MKKPDGTIKQTKLSLFYICADVKQNWVASFMQKA